MLPISIRVNQLGALRNSDISIYPVMIFSGQSGLGKSHLALLVHYIYALLLSPLRLNAFFEQYFPYNTLHPKMQGKGEIVRFEKNKLECWMAEDAKSYLREMLRCHSLPVDVRFFFDSKVPEYFVISYEEELSGLTDNETVDVRLVCDSLSMLAVRQNLDLIQYDNRTVEKESPFSFLTRHYLKQLLLSSYESIKQDVILPPARAVALTEFVKVDKGLYKSYIDWLASASRTGERKADKYHKVAECLHAIMEGEVRLKDTLNYVYKMSKGTEVPVTVAASSVRELAPLQFLIENDPSGAVVLLEEPETNLHAEKQRKMAEIVSLLASYGAHLQITTHSDYFLRRINELIALSRFAGDSELISKIRERVDIDEELAFPVDRIAHYILERRENGSSEAVEDSEIKDGLSFSAFKKAIIDGLEMSELFNDYGEN